MPIRVARAAQADAIRHPAVAGAAVVPAARAEAAVGGRLLDRVGAAGDVDGAVQEITVLVDAETDVAAGDAVIAALVAVFGVGGIGPDGRVEVLVRAAVRERAAGGADVGELAGILQEEADAVRAVIGRIVVARAITRIVGFGGEGHLHTLAAQGKAEIREDAAVFEQAIGDAAVPGAHGPCVGEAQRAADGRAVGQRAGIAADQRLGGIVEIRAAARNGLVVIISGHPQLDARGDGSGTGQRGRGARGEAGAVHEVPGIDGIGAGEVFRISDGLRGCPQGREREGTGRHGDQIVPVHHCTPKSLTAA